MVDRSEAAPIGADQAEGHQPALEALAETRKYALNTITRLFAQHNTFNSPILPEGAQGGRSPHSEASAAVLAYHTLLCKHRRLDATDAWDYYKEPFTTVPVPEELVENGVIEIEMNDMANGSIDNHLSGLPLVSVKLSLKDVKGWRDRKARFKKVPGNPYETYRNPEFTERNMALPPRTLADVFSRLDDLADHYGVLINIQKGGEESAGEYSDVVDSDTNINV